MADSKIITLENGIKIEEAEDGFYLVFDTERLPVADEDVELIKKNPDYAFNVVIFAKRKYWFNTAMDRYDPTDY